MDDPAAPHGHAGSRRFGLFEFDEAALELRKAGHLVGVRPQALKLLALLLARAGEVVPRPDLEHALWDTASFVDHEQGVNHAIRELRSALGDAADSPRFIQTLPRRGYRFIAPLLPARPEETRDARPSRGRRERGPVGATRAHEAGTRPALDGGWWTAIVGAGVLAGVWLLWYQRFGRNRTLRALSR